MTTPHQVIVHPTVLLGIVDHYNRISKPGEPTRAVGILLGHWKRDTQDRWVVECVNYYAVLVPFDQNPSNPNVYFLDCNYHEEMYKLFRKLNTKDGFIGWYSSGSSLDPIDLDIHEMLRKYSSSTPIFLLVDVETPQSLQLPTRAFYSIEDLPQIKSLAQPTPSPSSTTSTTEPSTDTSDLEIVSIPMKFQKLVVGIGAVEAEEIGVEHILRDYRDSTVTDLGQELQNKINSLKILSKHIKASVHQVDLMISGQKSYNHRIVSALQEIFYMLPNLSLESFIQDYTEYLNDQHMTLYLTTLFRAITGIHNLIDNKLQSRQVEKKALLESESSSQTTSKSSKNTEDKTKTAQ